MTTAEASLPDSAQRALHDLYSDHHGWLRGWLRKHTGCTEQAADLTHDTFLQVLLAAQPVAPKEPRAYLTTIAKRLLFNFWRRRDLERAYLEALAQLPAEYEPSLEERALVVEALVRVDRLLDGLSAKARAAFLYSQLDGLTYADIGARLGVSASRVRQYIAQALRRCLTVLEQ